MSNKLFVGGLSWDTSDASLRAAFEAHGEVRDAKVVTARDTGRRRGFGFVPFGSADPAQPAIAALDGTRLAGRSLRVHAAPDTPRGGGGGYGRDRY